ncbi:class I SAM-dependent methyltransferase [Spirochaeta africana]|uniref:Methyltransferase family protein n=1 Tax=Spirochaeta africana (strain ATCC 700263 / DSM 8902 / Z-7692) TaxID=889378 RepID=H9ULE1_SPIAZ|nr:class I SAM-dependent methyltransferase [Spirochaeta africana]AFG38334.1 methyltransferase family protein [Spirochaeta africana DSM 8902]
MDLYQKIAAEYAILFPSSTERLHCIERRLAQNAARDILDIGCASGELTRQLAVSGRHVTGIDPNEAMIDEARRQAAQTRAGALQYQAVDMLAFLGQEESGHYDALLCLGNTLAYLPGAAGLRDFMESAARVLRPGGYLGIQLLNYDNPVIGPGFHFPVLEGPRLRMSRRYQSLDGQAGYGFATAVTDTETGITSRDLHTHYPFRREEIAAAARSAGFARVEVYGDYRNGPVHRESFFVMLHVWKYA